MKSEDIFDIYMKYGNMFPKNDVPEKLPCPSCGAEGEKRGCQCGCQMYYYACTSCGYFWSPDKK